MKKIAAGFATAVVAGFVIYKMFFQAVTYNRDIAPILYSHCVTCHRPGEVGPFSLLTYEDAAKRARLIEDVTETRYMPPWIADRDYQHYANERGLSAQEIQAIGKWSRSGAPRGRGAAPPAPVLESGRIQKKPDLEYRIPKPYLVEGKNQDRFVHYYFFFDHDVEKEVSGVEFRPDNKKLVHHANIGIYALDELPSPGADNGPILMETDADKARYVALTKNLVYFGGWVPGTTPLVFPPDTGFYLPKRGVVVLGVHYSPTPVAVTDQLMLRVFYTHHPILKEVKHVVIKAGLDDNMTQVIPPFTMIPAGTVQTYSAVREVPLDVTLLAVQPHMHFIGKSFEAHAVAPGNRIIPLVKIDHWSFYWQELYEFKEPVRIPAHSKIMIRATYDNTASNPANPFNPPQDIKAGAGMGVRDEMLTFLLVYVN